MKINKLLVALMAMATVFTACGGKDSSKDEPDPSTTPGSVSVAIVAPATSVKAGETLQLTAVVAPQGTALVWTVDNQAVATIDQTGLLTGVSAGSVMVTVTAGTASDRVAITVTAAEAGGNTGRKTKDDVKGAQIWPVYMDAPLLEYAPVASRIVKSFTIDDVLIWHDWWNDGQSLELAAKSGQNFYATSSDYLAAKALWGGYGGWSWDIYATATQKIADSNELLAAVKAAPADYYLHIATKSTDQATLCIKLWDAVAFCIGAEVVDNGNVIKSVGNYERNGEWTEFDINLGQFATALAQVQPNPNDGTTGVVFLGTFLLGGIENAVMNLDAIYFYKL